MFFNHSNQQLPANRGPLQPATAMQSTGRHYITEVYGTKPNGQRYKLTVTQWSTDRDANKLPAQFAGMGKTTMRAANKGEC